MNTMMKDLQTFKKQKYSLKPIKKYSIKLNEVIKVKELIKLIKKLLDIKVETVIYQKNE